MSQETALATIQEGQKARIIRADVEDWIISREEDIISRLVSSYNADTLTNDKLRGSIGEIASLRAFRMELEGKIRRGVMAAEVELGEKNG